jgi:hypothetical protein
MNYEYEYIETIIIETDTYKNINEENDKPLEEIFNEDECYNIHVAIVDKTPICYLSHGFYSVCSCCCCIFCCKKVCVCCIGKTCESKTCESKTCESKTCESKTCESKTCESKTCGNCNFDEVQLKKSKMILDSGWGDIIEQQKDIKRKKNINDINHKSIKLKR